MPGLEPGLWLLGQASEQTRGLLCSADAQVLWTRRPEWRGAGAGWAVGRAACEGRLRQQLGWRLGGRKNLGTVGAVWSPRSVQTQGQYVHHWQRQGVWGRGRTWWSLCVHGRTVAASCPAVTSPGVLPAWTVHQARATLTGGPVPVQPGRSAGRSAGPSADPSAGPVSDPSALPPAQLTRGHQVALSSISYVGCSLSVLCLAVTLATFAMLS